MFMMPLLALFLFGPALADEVAFTQNAVEVKNRTGHPIACAAQLAHWFSEDLGVVAPGDALRIDFTSDPATGTVFIRNVGGERMPIEASWVHLSHARLFNREQNPGIDMLGLRLTYALN